MEKQKKSVFETPLLSSKIKSANVSLFPEGALGYLVGPTLALMSNGIVNTYLVQYWNKVLLLNVWAGLFEVLLPLLSSILIIAGNLFVGKLMERKPTVAGKARPFILVGMPLIAIALLILFLVPFPYGVGKPSFTPNYWSLIMIAIGYNLYYAFAYPFYYTSHSALVNLSTRDGSKRSLLATIQNASQLAASGLAGMVGPFIITALDLLAEKDDSEAGREAANSKWVILMIIMIACLVLGCLVEYFFTRERISEEQLAQQQSIGERVEEKNKVPMKTQIRICLHDKYWWIIIVFFFLYQLGGMLKNNGGTWYSQAFTGNTNLSGTINIVGAIPTGLGMLVIWPLCNKFGKGKTIKYGSLIAFLMGLVGFTVLLVPTNEAAVSSISIATFVLKAIGTVPAMYISLALLGDVLEHQEALYGKRTDGFTMAVYGSIMVAMSGIANAIIVGFNNLFPNTKDIANNFGNQFANTALFFGGEAVCYLIIAILFIFMDVERFSKVDRDAIVDAQKAKALAEGVEYVETNVRLAKEQEEAERVAEEESIAELKKKCEKKNLNFDEELRKYNENKAAKAKEAEEKKKVQEAKSLEKKKQRQEKYDALSQEQKDKLAEKEHIREEKRLNSEKRAAEDFVVLKEKADAFVKANNL